MVWLNNLPDEWWSEYQLTAISPQCIQELNIELLFLVRSLILETRSYARVCKRARIFGNDFQAALDARKIHLSVNIEEEIISVSSDQLSSKIDELKLSIHWLAIDGEQPIIPENPVPIFNEENSAHKKQQRISEKKITPSLLADQSPLVQKLFEMANSTNTNTFELQHHVHPLTMNNLIVKPIPPRTVSAHRPHINNNITSSLAHELSLEQQLYFKMLTETCFNGTDKQRTDTFRCLSSDAALQPLLPRLLLFISQGIQTNIHLHDLHFISRFISILKMLTINIFISFDKYLHLIIPSLLTCLVCIFDMPKSTNSSTTIDQNTSNNYSTIWIVREQASDLISYFEKKYSTIPDFTERIVSIVKSNLSINNSSNTFSIVYACIRTLFSIDSRMYNSLVINILQEFKKTDVLEPDFDLDHIEQQTLFDQKIDELFKK